VTRFEAYTISPDTRRLYEMMGHRVRVWDSQGRAMGIYVDPATDLRYGAADSRSLDGRAVGY
jgi:gamma-glutamyltranspeptidase/glutathione hydrolase